MEYLFNLVLQNLLLHRSPVANPGPDYSVFITYLSSILHTPYDIFAYLRKYGYPRLKITALGNLESEIWGGKQLVCLRE
jgi:hypothetical protein